MAQSLLQKIRGAWNDDASKLGIVKNTFAPSSLKNAVLTAPKWNLGANSQSRFVRTAGAVGSALLNPFHYVRDYANEASNQYYGNTPANTKKLIGMGGRAALELGTLGIGASFVTKTAQQAMGKVTPGAIGGLYKTLAKNAWRGSSLAGKIGAGYGLTDSLTENANPLQTVANIGQGYLGGRVLGSAIGFGAGAGPALFKAGVGSLSGKLFRTADKTPYFTETVKQVGKGAAEFSRDIPRPGLSIKDVSKSSLEPQIGPRLSGKIPVTPPTPSALQASRRVALPGGKSVFITGEPQNLTGTTATITRTGKQRQVAINQEPPAVNRPLDSVPLLPAGETPPVLRLPQYAESIQPTTTLAQIEQRLLGNEALTPVQGGNPGVGKLGSFLRKGEERVDEIASAMLSSENPLARTTANLLRGFAGTLGKTQELMRRTTAFHGQGDYGTKLANTLRDLIPDDPKTLERLHSNLDPELYGGKVAQLSAEEAEKVSLLRLISDYINDTNFRNGFISRETWAKNRGGKYISRAYESYDMPPEIADFMKQGTAKFDLNPFKKRGELTDWKIDDSIKDPVYLMQKRLQQTLFNDATKRLFGWLGQQGQYVSQTAKNGYTKISDHPAYGDLAGKWVRKDVMEDIQGLYFEHQALQSGYDVLKWYDRNPLRRGLKKMMTVFNPVVRVGNNTGNYVFAWLHGINPKRFTQNLVWASKAAKSNDPLYLRAQRDGILSTGTHRGDIVQYAEELKRGVTDQNILKQIDEIASKSYQHVDDRAKLAALKTFMERGISYDEAVRNVMRGFQNYHAVGFLYDIGAKLPILGNPFVRFQGSLMSILKSAGIDHPIRLIGTGLAIKYLGDVMSRVSGETEEDKATREGRVGAPHIPFTDISLEVQTPFGAVNAARFIGVYAGNPVGGNSISNDLSRVLPFKDPTDVRNYGSDVLAGPLVNTFLTDTDFRGKPISDPDETKYKPSTLTPEEKMVNQAQYLQRAYTPTFINSLVDAGSAVMGKPDFYGRTRTPGQAISSALGVRVEQYGPEQAQEQRLKDYQFEQYAREDAKRGVNAVLKAQAKGEIDQETAAKRIKNLTSGLSDGAGIPGTDQRIVQNPFGGFSYLDDNGDFKTVDSLEKAEKNVAKLDFAKTDEPIMEWRDRIFRKNEDGTISDMATTRYTELLLDAELVSLKNQNDFAGWFNAAKRLYQNLTAQLESPNIDQLEATRIKNQIATLVKTAAKHKKWGGFTKPKKGKKPKKMKFKLEKGKTLSGKITAKRPGSTYKKVNFSLPSSSQSGLGAIRPFKL